MPETKKCIVYKHTNKINGKVYIGITSKKPNARWQNGTGYKSQFFFWRAIQKYGWDNFEHEILFENLKRSEAYEKEIELIAFYKSADRKYGYNFSKGGVHSNLNCKYTRKVREYTNLTQEHKNKIAKSIICLDTLKVYNSTREASLDTGINYKFISRVLNGHAKSCHGLHFIFLKDYNPNLKYELYSQHKTIRCIEAGVIYNSLAECSKIMNLSKSSISHVLNGKRKTHKGFHFEYYNEEIRL